MGSGERTEECFLDKGRRRKSLRAHAGKIAGSEWWRKAKDRLIRICHHSVLLKLRELENQRSQF